MSKATINLENSFVVFSPKKLLANVCCNLNKYMIK